MKKNILTFLLAVATTTLAFCEQTTLPMQIHQAGSQSGNLERDRNPICLPLAVFYDMDTNILEVWCDDDNIQAEVYVYDESGTVEAYSPYMKRSLNNLSGSFRDYPVDHDKVSISTNDFQKGIYVIELIEDDITVDSRKVAI